MYLSCIVSLTKTAESLSLLNTFSLSLLKLISTVCDDVIAANFIQFIHVLIGYCPKLTMTSVVTPRSSCYGYTTHVLQINLLTGGNTAVSKPIT